MTVLLVDDLEISKDGLTYIIDRTHCEQSIATLLREDSDGWLLTDDSGSVLSRIGRRKTLHKALYDALVLIDDHLEKKAHDRTHETHY